MEISEKEYKELKLHSQMLGFISIHVEDFCEEEDTTLIGVMKLLADYYALRGENLMYQAREQQKQFMKIEKGKFYSIHYKGEHAYVGTGECIKAYENGTSGDFKLPDGQIGHFYAQDILYEMKPQSVDSH